MALPIRSNGQLSAVVCLRLPGGIDREAAELARQIADQIGIGLANARLVEELDALSLSSIRALARTIDTSSPWTSGHSERVAQLGVAIGAAMNLTPHQLDEIHRGGLLHDIGKIGVPKEVLDKPGRLTDEEFDAMKAHPVIGVRILELIRQFEPLLPLVRSHHEKLDGTGYPDGLKGDEIHLYAKILAVADVWDAITSDRPYRDGMPYEKALGVIREGAGNHFDPRCVSAFSVIARDWYQTPVEVGQDFIQSLEAGVLV